MKVHNHVLAGVLLVLGATSLLAQSQPLHATIPFDFYASGKLLPAGDYLIIPSAVGQAIQLRGNNGEAAFVLVRGDAKARATADNHLLFQRYGTANFLTAVHWMGFPSSKMVVTSKMEQELARIHGSPATATVAAK